MALDAYLALTQQLLQNPSAPVKLYDPALLKVYINQARGQLAGDSQAIKRIGSYALTTGLPGPYPFSSITLTNATGVQGVLNVRQQWFIVGSGQIWFRSRPWPWYSIYHLNSAAPDQGPPESWAQYGDGEDGSIYIGPQPDDAYTINTDCVCFPVDLIDDTTPEKIPAPWTIAVPYYAAYLALLSSQTSTRTQDAEVMFQLYEKFVGRARQFSTPEIIPGNFPQQANPTRQNQLGQGGGGGAGGAGG